MLMIALCQAELMTISFHRLAPLTRRYLCRTYVYLDLPVGFTHCSPTKVLSTSTSNQRRFLRNMQIKLFSSADTISVCDILWEIFLCFSDKRHSVKGACVFYFYCIKLQCAFSQRSTIHNPSKAHLVMYHVKLGKGFMC